jgi:hypothetical protein
MAHLTIDVPEALIDPLRRELQRAHAACAAALLEAFDGYRHSGASLDPVAGALVELRDLDAALAQLGGHAPVTLTIHPEVLADALQRLRLARPDDEALRALAATVG